jgi:HK97 family phage major capsid protein/HK97 family phage prohead protease
MRYQQRSAPPPAAEPMEFVLSDGAIDRMGDVVEPSGWQLDNFRAHPIALFNHDRDQIIGRWADVRVRGDKLIGRLELAEQGTSPLVDTVRALVRQGILRAVSVGFRGLERKPLTEKASSDFGPFRFVKSELLECSLVSIPANPNALAIAKDLPRDLVAEVFRKPASEDVDPRVKPGDQAADHRKPAKSLVQKSTTTMSRSGTLAQKIQAAQQNWNVLRESLDELGNKEELTEEESKRYDELPAQVEAAKAEIEKHKRAERALFDGGGNGSTAMTTVEVQREQPQQEVLQGQIMPPRAPFALAGMKPKLEPSDYGFRALAAWAKSQAVHDRPDKIFNEMYGSDKDAEFAGTVLRAAVNPAQTTVATWAAELVSTTLQALVDRLVAEFIYPQLAGMGVRYTFGTSGILKIPVRAATPTIAGAWVGEGAAKPVKRASFATVSLTPTKLAVISTFTEEMALYSNPAIEGVIRQAMADDTGNALDAFLLDAVAASASRPAGLLNGVTPLTPSAATPDTVAMVEDLKALVGAIVAAGGGRNIAILLNPTQAMALNFAQTTTGDFLFADRTEAGQKFGVRFIVSTTVPVNRVIAVDAADFATATGDAPRFAVSTEATIHEEDTTPLAIGTPGAPATVAAPTRSLFQTDAVAIRMSLYVNWVMRRTGMVQTMSPVIW